MSHPLQINFEYIQHGFKVINTSIYNRKKKIWHFKALILPWNLGQNHVNDHDVRIMLY